MFKDWRKIDLTVLLLLSSGSYSTTVLLLVKPISPLAMSAVTVKVRFRGPPNLGLLEGIGTATSTRTSESSWIKGFILSSVTVLQKEPREGFPVTWIRK